MNAKSTILSIIKALIMPLVVFLLFLYLKNFGDILTGLRDLTMSIHTDLLHSFL